MTFYRKTVVLMIAALIPTAALAESLEEKRWHAGEEKSLKRAIEDMNKACGITIATKIDWTTFKFDDWSKHHVGMMCLPPVRAVQQLCGQADGKEAIGKAVKTLTCKGADAPGIELNGGAIEFKVTTKKTPTQDEAKSYLLKKI
jgi:hypothetical protein